MIKKFGSLYAGWVDMDDVGLEGTPVNERWLPDEQLATVTRLAPIWPGMRWPLSTLPGKVPAPIEPGARSRSD